MKVTIQEVEAAGRLVATAFAAFNPEVGASVIAVLDAAQKATEMAQKVLAQAQEDPVVRDQISADFQSALDKWNASVAAHPGV